MTAQDVPLSCRVAADTAARRGSEYLWHYEHGLFLLALRRLAEVYRREDLSRGPREFVSAYVSPDGAIASYRLDDYNLDQIHPGRVLLCYPDAPGVPEALATLRRQLDTQPRTASGGYWHKKIYPDQMWLDGLYMAEPFAVGYGRLIGSTAALDEAVLQFRLMESAARDPRTGLLSHAWDESRRQLWSDPNTGRSPHFWGRAMGWFVLALVEVLDLVPSDHPAAAELSVLLVRTLEAVRRVQDPETGLWWQVLDQGSRAANYLETSATALFAAAQAKAARKGWVPPEPARTSAWTALKGLAAHRLVLRDGRLQLTGICSVAGLGGTPYRDGSFDYYVSEKVVADDYKGVAPYLLALLEREAWENPTVAARLAEAEVPPC